jgi:hypothetical protein
MFDGIFRGGGYLEIFGVEEAGYRWALIDKELMLNQALLEGSDVRSMVSQQEVLDNVFSPLFLANRVSADRLLPIVIENIRSLRSLYQRHVSRAHARTTLQIHCQVQPSRGCSSARVYGAPVPGVLPSALHVAALSHPVPRHRGVKGHRSHAVARCSPACAEDLCTVSDFMIHRRVAVDEAYPGATQLALDMLLKVDAHEELIMVLLQRQQVISALKYVRERNIIVSAASFLKAAKATGDDCAPPPPCCSRCTPTFLSHAQQYFMPRTSSSSL